jgi:hypothetical protein
MYSDYIRTTLCDSCRKRTSVAVVHSGVEAVQSVCKRCDEKEYARVAEKQKKEFLEGRL